MVLGRPLQRGLNVGKAPLGPFGLIKIKLLLTEVFIPMILLTHISSNCFLVQPYRTYTITRCPKVQPSHPSIFHQFPMHTNCALALQESNRIRNAIFWRNAQHHVDMIRHGVPLQQFNTTLLAQITQYFANLATHPSVKHLLTVFWSYHKMILAFPSYVRQTSPVMHGSLSFAPTGLPLEGESTLSTTNLTTDRSKPLRVHGQRPWV